MAADHPIIPHGTEALSVPEAPATVTARALAVGLAMSVVVCGIVAWAEWVNGTIMIGFLQIPPVAVALLLIVVLINRLAGRIWPRLRLRSSELTIVYVTMVFAAMIASRGLTEDLYPMQVGLGYFATPANHWQDLFFSHVKPALLPWNPAEGQDQPVVQWYFEGLPGGVGVPWRPWLTSTGLWLILVGLVYAAFLAIAAIAYGRWADDEHLSFPLTRLPLEMVTARPAAGDFLRNPLMWIGFLAPVIYFGLNGLHQIWPQVPQIKTSYELQPTAMPWRNIGYTVMWFSLAGVGLFYLLPSEIVFSLWFFFVFARLQEVAAAAWVGPSSQAPHAASVVFVGDETTGVCFTLVALMVYTSWTYLREAARRGEAAPPGHRALMPFRSALWLLAVAIVGILVWWHWAGGSVSVGLLEFGVYLFVQAIIMARATSEAGTPMTEGSFTPFDLLGYVAAQRKVGATNLTLLSFTNALFTRDLRGITVTGMLDAQKLGDGVGLSRRKLVPVIIVAIVLAVVVSGYMNLKITESRCTATCTRATTSNSGARMPPSPKALNPSARPASCGSASASCCAWAWV
jgi:hypothetical protein